MKLLEFAVGRFSADFGYFLFHIVIPRDLS